MEIRRGDKFEDMELEITDMMSILSDVNMRLSNTEYDLRSAVRIINILIDKTDILDVSDFELNSQRTKGISTTKYKPNTLVRIENTICLVVSGKILDDNRYEYDLLYVKGGQR